MWMPEPTAESLRQQCKQMLAEHGLPEQAETAVRLHRVCKWLGVAQALYAGPPQDQPLGERELQDLGFITCWISWNALYSRWDEQGQAEAEFASMRTCLGDLLKVDREGFLAAWVYREREAIGAVMNNPFLYRHFWLEVGREDGDLELMDPIDRTLVTRLIDQQRWARLFEDLFGRLYVLRNQLIHGGATPGGSINRVQVAHGRILEGFMVAAIRAIIHGNDPWHDWGHLPYPVLEVE